MSVKLSLVFAAIAVFSTVSALPRYSNNEDESGHYTPDDSGQYIPDDSGRYYPDRTGEYRSDGTGRYANDGSGHYKGDLTRPYKVDNFDYQKNDFSEFTGGKTHYNSQKINNKFNSGASSIIGTNSNFVESSSNLNRQVTGGYNKFKGTGAFNFGNDASATNLVSSQRVNYPNPNPSGRYADGRWRIIRQDGDVDTDGYHWEYETENGITAEESGKVHNKGTDAEAMKAKGFFTYTGPDNVVYHTEYTADENGFVPVGNHLPTPPPIPGSILKALDYLRSTNKL